jgi:hypothetical protein
MRKLSWVGVMAVAALIVGFAAAEVSAGSLAPVTGKELDQAVGKTFYLEGNAIPVQARNAALLKNKHGKRLLFALLDTTGYSTEVQKKYHGMAVLEKKVTIGGAALGVGAYGIGLETPAEGAEGPATVIFYDVAGNKVASASVEKNKELKGPKPLQVVAAEGKAPCLCLGVYCLEIK